MKEENLGEHLAVGDEDLDYDDLMEEDAAVAEDGGPESEAKAGEAAEAAPAKPEPRKKQKPLPEAMVCELCEQETTDYNSKSTKVCRPCKAHVDAAERDAKKNKQHEHFKTLRKKNPRAFNRFIMDWIGATGGAGQGRGKRRHTSEFNWSQVTQNYSQEMSGAAGKEGEYKCYSGFVRYYMEEKGYSKERAHDLWTRRFKDPNWATSKDSDDEQDQVWVPSKKYTRNESAWKRGTSLTVGSKVNKKVSQDALDEGMDVLKEAAISTQAHMKLVKGAVLASKLASDPVEVPPIPQLQAPSQTDKRTSVSEFISPGEAKAWGLKLPAGTKGLSASSASAAGSTDAATDAGDVAAGPDSLPVDDCDDAFVDIEIEQGKVRGKEVRSVAQMSLEIGKTIRVGEATLEAFAAHADDASASTSGAGGPAMQQFIDTRDLLQNRLVALKGLLGLAADNLETNQKLWATTTAQMRPQKGWLQCLDDLACWEEFVGATARLGDGAKSLIELEGMVEEHKRVKELYVTATQSAAKTCKVLRQAKKSADQSVKKLATMQKKEVAQVAKIHATAAGKQEPTKKARVARVG